jgi:ABC-type antimicrobial peptide transport system permease subunit
MALINLSHRGIRTWLTMLGIIVGIAAVVSLISLGQGLQETIRGEFEKLGTTSFDAKNKIKLLQDAIWEQTKVTKALTDLDIVNKTQSELSTASQLAKTYSELSEKKNKSAKETALLKEKSELLKATLNNLNIEYTVGSDGLISNVDGIQKLIVSQQNLTDVEKAEVIERINNKKAELDATLKYIKTELEARQILARASFYETQKFQGVLSDPLNVKGGGASRTGTEQDKLSAMMDESLKGKQKQIEDTLNAYNGALDELAKKSAGTPNLLSSPDSKTTKEKAKKESTKQ